MKKDLNTHKINQLKNKNHAPSICTSTAEKPTHRGASKKSVCAHHWASALSGLLFSAFLSPDAADAVFFKDLASVGASIREVASLTRDDSGFPIARNCVSVINQLTGGAENNSSFSSGILLDGGRYVLTAMHVLTNASPETLKVVQTAQMDFFFHANGTVQAQKSLDLFSEKHPEKFSTVKAFYPLGHFKADEETHTIRLRTPEELLQNLQERKEANKDVFHLLFNKGHRNCGTQNRSYTVHGNDLALIELTEPIEGTVPWVHKIPDALPENQIWDEALVLGYSHFARPANKAGVWPFTRDLPSGEKVCSWKAMAIRMENLSLKAVPDAYKQQLPEGYAPLPDAHVAYATYEGTFWEELFQLPEGAPRHTGKPSNSCSGALTLVRNKNADGTFGSWIPLGLLTTELLDSIATTDKMEGQLSGAIKAAASQERAGWPQHQIVDVLAPSIKTNLLKVLEGTNPFPLMTPENEPALSPQEPGQDTSAGKHSRMEELVSLMRRAPTPEAARAIVLALSPEDQALVLEISQQMAATASRQGPSPAASGKG